MAETNPDGSPSGMGWTPIPDPTLLTSSLVDKAKEEMRRELTASHEGLMARIEGVLALLVARHDAADKAVVLLQTAQDRVPTHVSDQIQHLQNLMEQRFATIEERFRSIALQFQERDVRSEQSSTATKIAIDAALQAQKEMVAAQNTNIAQALARIEATGQKQTEQVVTLAQTSSQATNDKVDDLKERLSLIEGRTAGITAAGTTQLASQQVSQGASSNTMALAAMGISLLGMVITIVVTIILNR